MLAVSFTLTLAFYCFLLQVKNVTYSLKYTEEHILKISHIFHSYRDKKFHNRE